MDPDQNFCRKHDGLTQPLNHQGHLRQLSSGRRHSLLRSGPADPGAVQPGVDVVPAQRFSLGHQLLVGGRPVEHLGRKHGGAPQHLHVPERRSSSRRRRRSLRGFSRSTPPSPRSHPPPHRGSPAAIIRYRLAEIILQNKHAD